MNIFVDHFYEKGDSHEVCQDYALSKQNKDYAFFIVSDGCGSAKNTEVGSVVMSHSLKSAIETLWYREKPIDITKRGSVQKITQNKANEVKKTLELLQESLYATLLIGFLDKQTKEFAMAAWGDGTFVMLYEDGDYDIHSIEYENNAPFYMAYNNDESSIQSYIQNCGGRSTVSYTAFDMNGNWICSKKEHIEKPNVIKIYPKREKRIKGIFGFSDGIDSFKTHPHTMINKCLDFKNINETFIRRKGKRVLKDSEKNRDLPYDDFSFAGIIVK